MKKLFLATLMLSTSLAFSQDSISGIDPKEKSFEIKLNGNRLFCAYQPVKKQITYDIDKGMNPGNHQLDIVVDDRVGNKKNHTVSFTCK